VLWNGKKIWVLTFLRLNPITGLLSMRGKLQCSEYLEELYFLVTFWHEGHHQQQWVWLVVSYWRANILPERRLETGLDGQ